jgi:cytochrome c oxidase subunit II
MLHKYFPLWPDQASTVAGHVDALYIFLLLVTAFFTAIIVAMVVGFCIKYRKGKNPVATQIEGSVALELFWTVVPLAIAMMIFVWGAVLYFRLQRAPQQALDVYVVGKQWMWKMQHPSGPREINQLHIPVHTPVRLTMISQDVIHSFYVPEFRTKMDVLPGRYTYTWFEANKTGTFHIFCAEYCGTKHSGMIGEVVVMEPVQYQVWLSGGSEGGNLASGGEKLFTSLGCITCHSGQAGARGPVLAGIYGKQQKLSNGTAVTVDDNYIRNSILNPQLQIVQGFEPIMPTFSGQVSEESLVQLIAYIKSLQGSPGQAGGQPVPAAGSPQRSGPGVK